MLITPNSITDTFIVRGNILLQGNAVLWVHGKAGSEGNIFIVSNKYNGQRTITTLDGTAGYNLEILNSEPRGIFSGAASWTMNFNAEGKSIFYVYACIFATSRTAWLLCNLKD